jgi:hypothetical protein
MYVDEWLTEVNEIEFVGASMESCNQLINYCQQNQIAYSAQIDYNANGMKYTLTAKANNEVAYVMIRDYKNRGGN